jgi:hypothetical protein
MAQLTSEARPTDTSRTITITESQAGPSQLEGGALRLRGGPRRTRRRVAWDEDVVDNEGCGRKKSKSTFLLDIFSSEGAEIETL